MVHIIKNNIVVEKADTKENLIELIDFNITENGTIRFNNEIDTISYCVRSWTIEEIKKDFIKNRLAQMLKNQGYTMAASY